MTIILDYDIDDDYNTNEIRQEEVRCKLYNYMDKYDYNLKEVSQMYEIKYSTLCKFKNGKIDFSKGMLDELSMFLEFLPRDYCEGI